MNHPAEDHGGTDAAAAGRKAPTGVEGLDRILEGGLPEQEVFLVQGAPGTGKTLLGLHFLLAGRDRGERGLFFTLTQRPSDLHRTASSHGWTLEGIDVHQLAAGRPAAGGASDQALFETSEVELVETMEEVRSVVERVGPARIVFDAVAELRFLSGEPGPFQRQLFTLREIFAASGATVVFLDRQPPVPGADELEHIAHGVITLEHSPTELGTNRRRLRVVKMRGMGFREGLHDFRIETGGLTVFPRLRQDEERRTEWRLLESGLPPLDALVGGGLACGTSCLLLGPSGTGKTTVATRYALAAAERGEASGLFLFEERPETFVRRSESLGMPVTQHIRSGLMRLRPVTTGELSPGEFAESVRQQVSRDNLTVVVIDSLTGYRSAMPSEQLLLTQMHDLLQYLSGRGVLTILVVAQHGILGSALGGPVDVSYLADAVLLLRHFEADGELRQAISVFKKRYGAHERQIRELRIAEGALEVGPPLSGFRGLLSGTPAYTGTGGELVPPQERAP